MRQNALVPVESSVTTIQQIPHFSLPDLSGHLHEIRVPFHRPLVVAFVCNHCPYVQWIERGLGDFAQKHDCDVVAICSNDTISYPEDDIPGLRGQIDRAQWGFPYLIDADQTIAHAFGAVCTPDFFLFDSLGRLVYRGAMDQSRPKSDHPVTAEYLIAALESLAQDTPMPTGRPSMGCGIKWKRQS